MKIILIIVLVVAVVLGLLLTLRSSRNLGTPSAEVLERAKERARTQAAKDESD